MSEEAKAANWEQKEGIENVLNLYYMAYGEPTETFSQFMTNFFNGEGQVFVPQDKHPRDWVFNVQVVPPEWLRNRIYPLPKGVIYNEE